MESWQKIGLASLAGASTTVAIWFVPVFYVWESFYTALEAKRGYQSPMEEGFALLGALFLLLLSGAIGGGGLMAWWLKRREIRRYQMTYWPDILGPVGSGCGAREREIKRFQKTLLAPLSEGEERSRDSGGNFDVLKWELPAFPLPPSYLDLLRYYDGGELGEGKRVIQLFSSHEVRPMMLSYHVPQYWPLAVPFAFDGGGTFYAFDCRLPPDERGEFPIVMSHSGDLGWEENASWKIADTLEECLLDPREPWNLRQHPA